MLRVGVIGTGGIGRAHVERIATCIPDAKVVAVNDISEESALAVAGQYGIRCEKDPHALIGAEDVDAVIVTTWDRTHEEFVVSAIREGKHVFCEKPLSNTSQGCRNIMDAEIAGGKRLLMVGFMRRYDKGYRQMKAAIEAQKLGEPLLVHAQHRNAAPTGEKHTTEMSVNGALVHEFDITRWLVNDEYETAQLICPKSTKNADEDLIDPQMVILRTKSGIHIDLEIYMNCRYGYDIQCEVVGEEGTVRLPDPANAIFRKDGGRTYEIYSGWAKRFEEAYETEMKEWVKCVLKDDLSECPTAWDGYVTAVVAEACTKARLTEGTVRIDLIEKPEFYN
ncbi:Gfo/Idh/MocA family oxidoreductase [Ruminococcus gauvreauii]|uniref:Inositol 2-dehydrogenase/D-chiro-inositol 3-dehydrogenase n=1 Tax=Ruminococcus gauvreauii TaxID=438033 RepID=A0ABY5VE25_9FIRM|nr:Gfo/Idh/MocA family oxidoreductase [Ruminococcus gauvreauii]UWP58869.1 Gfo/Idh/MocA family oxidoreductase [Ruminococcus gauvreauii]